jgi:hypothetical protein
MRRLRSSLRAALTKNGPELQAFLTGRMPSFVTRANGRAAPDGVPVFFFHDVEPDRFEAQLRYLQSNGYATLDADQLEARLRRPDRSGRDRAVALTFDDATWTFWAHAFPLLRRYQARAILFVISGIVPDDPAVYPNLEDLWAGRCSAADIATRAKLQPLCTWRELRALHASGLVDIQSHSLTHALVPVSARIDDFVHPGFAAGFANSDLPLAASDAPRRPARELRLGAPVFEAASRLCGRPRFLEAPELAQALIDRVAARGGASFFGRASWRRDLMAVLGAWPEERRGRFETPDETRNAVSDELALSKELLESRLPGKAVRHFCYPWFDGCDLADQLAAEVGYRTIHGGIGISNRDGAKMPLPVQRISEEYLFRLPGEGRSGIGPVWTNRMRGFITKAAGSR